VQVSFGPGTISNNGAGFIYVGGYPAFGHSPVRDLDSWTDRPWCCTTGQVLEGDPLLGADDDTVQSFWYVNGQPLRGDNPFQQPGVYQLTVKVGDRLPAEFGGPLYLGTHIASAPDADCNPTGGISSTGQDGLVDIGEGLTLYCFRLDGLGVSNAVQVPGSDDLWATTVAAADAPESERYVVISAGCNPFPAPFFSSSKRLR